MIKVITYGTYDLLHQGHIRLLERAKSLGDYLIVGITADSYDLARGKINVQQSLIERIEAVRAIGIADEIIVEEYEGQKIDDIIHFNVDIFTVGSDWKGHFDYLSQYCKVIYLDRTEGISSSELRTHNHELKIGLVGESAILNKFMRESQFVNGVKICGICSQNIEVLSEEIKKLPHISNDINSLIKISDALYIASHPSEHYQQAKLALSHGKHVLCESPIALSVKEYNELLEIAIKNNVQLVDSLKTAYSMAYNRMLLLLKAGIIGSIVSVDTICTSLSDLEKRPTIKLSKKWNSICAWGPTAMLPIFQLLGANYINYQITSQLLENGFDAFTKISFIYPHAVASLKVGKGVKSEGELIVTGSKGYIYVPSPWWKMDYFEVRFENPTNNKRFFYQLDGEGIRYEIVSFIKSIYSYKSTFHILPSVSQEIIRLIERFYKKDNFFEI